MPQPASSESQSLSVPEQEAESAEPITALSEHLCRIQDEIAFYRRVSLDTIPALEAVLIATMAHYARASTAMHEVLESFDSLSPEQREHILSLHGEYEDASSIAMRLSFQRLLEQHTEALALKQPGSPNLLQMFAADADAFVRATARIIKETETLLIGERSRE